MAVIEMLRSMLENIKGLFYCHVTATNDISSLLLASYHSPNSPLPTRGSPTLDPIR